MDLALKVYASQFLNAVLVDVEVADDDVADVGAVVADRPKQVPLEVLQHLVIVLSQEVRDWDPVLQVRRVALHLVIHYHHVFYSTPVQKDG